MDFVAIDFETANNDRSSACSIGIVEVRDGEIVSSQYALIRPPVVDFNQKLHGITPETVKHEKRFVDLWDWIRESIEGKTLAAHNATFDAEVMRSCLGFYGIKYPNVKRWVCSYRLARNFLPMLKNYQLPTVAVFLILACNTIMPKVMPKRVQKLFSDCFESRKRRWNNGSNIQIANRLAFLLYRHKMKCQTHLLTRF